MDRGVVFVIGFLLLFLQSELWVSANVVFQVYHKFTGNERSVVAYKHHDSYRHRRILSAADLPLGGNSIPTSAALYFTKIQIGTPPRDYHVQVDTGSDLLWVNCAGCVNCPQKSDLGIALALYDPMLSTSSRVVTCEQDFCTASLDTTNLCIRGTKCAYQVKYGDGSETTGYYVKDNVQLERVSGNLQTASMNGRITFGCGSRHEGGLGTSKQAVDGILGFGQANSSMLSQLASAKKVKKAFSHCLSGTKGGIFAIGEVVHPKVKTTPIMPHETHYNVELKAIKVGDENIRFPMYMYDSVSKRGTIIDSGTTLAYFPEEVYNQLMEKIMSSQPYRDMYTVEDVFTCYKYRGNVDDGFPTVTFYFANFVELKVYPRQYLFQDQNRFWCIGFLSNGVQPKAGKDLTLLGDIALMDRLVTYNMEDQTIGWTDYDCSSSISVKDDETGRVYEVGAHDISSSVCTCASVLAWVVGIVIASKMVMY